MDTLEKLARQAAETINGGEFYDGKWYTEGQRQAWRKAMTPAVEEIERLREALQKIAAIDDERLPEPSTPEEAVLWTTLTICVDLARKATGGE